MAIDELVEVWRTIIVGGDKSWVLFEQGTCVILMEPEPDLAAQATEIMREFGPVAGGTPAGDFGTVDLDAAPGWAVWGHHPDVLTYVAPAELDGVDGGADGDDLRIGLFGRGKRGQDGADLNVVHVEDKRPA